ERLREAQERVREVRNGVAAEVRGLEAGLPDGAALAAARQAAEQRLSGARRSAKSADVARRAAEDALGREEPRWNEWMARRERTLSLDGERRMAEQAVVSSRQEFQRLDKELADALAAREQLRALGAELAPVARLKQEVAALEGLQRESATRRTEGAERDQIVKLGPQGTCPTCKRPLGPEYAGVLALLDAQLEVITVDGKYFRQRLEQLAQSPAKLLEAETERDRVLEESRRASARAGE